MSFESVPQSENTGDAETRRGILNKIAETPEQKKKQEGLLYRFFHYKSEAQIKKEKAEESARIKEKQDIERLKNDLTLALDEEPEKRIVN